MHDEESTFKAKHVHRDYAFEDGDSGKPTPIVQFDYDALDPQSEALIDRLMNVGIPLALAERAAGEIKDLVQDLVKEKAEEHGRETARECLRRMADKLGKSAPGRALRRVITGDRGQSLSDDAKEVKTDKQLIHYHQVTTKEKIGVFDEPPNSEGSNVAPDLLSYECDFENSEHGEEHEADASEPGR